MRRCCYFKVETIKQHTGLWGLGRSNSNHLVLSSEASSGSKNFTARESWGKSWWLRQWLQKLGELHTYNLRIYVYINIYIHINMHINIQIYIYTDKHIRYKLSQYTTLRIHFRIISSPFEEKKPRVWQLHYNVAKSAQNIDSIQKKVLQLPLSAHHTICH